MSNEASSFSLVATLGMAGLLSGLALVGAYEITLPTIDANKAAFLNENIFEVLPGTETMRPLTPDGDGLRAVSDSDDKSLEKVYAGFDASGAFVGYAIPADGKGFQDTISLLYGYSPAEKKIIGMRVLGHLETPGLGDKIVKDDVFVGNFDKLAVSPEIRPVKNKGDGRADNEVDCITGATISSKAIVQIINLANEQWVERLNTAESPKDEGGGS